jgi:hypothetical protein
MNAAVNPVDIPEEKRIENFLHDLALHEGYNVTPMFVKQGHNIASGEHKATKEFKEAVRKLLKKHGLIFA